MDTRCYRIHEFICMKIARTDASIATVFFIAITIGKSCFKSIKAIIGTYVVTPFKIING